MCRRCCSLWISRWSRHSAGALAEVHEQVAGLLSGPGAGGAGGDARDVHPPGLDLHQEEDVQAFEEHGVSVQEVARQIPDAWEVRNRRQVGDARRSNRTKRRRRVFCRK